MRKEIGNKSIILQIERKETRRRKSRNILIIMALVAFLYFVPQSYPQISELSILGFFLGLFGAVYIVFDAIPALYQPLNEEHYAFAKIARAIEILEKSNEPIAYEEAYRCVRRAHKVLHAKIAELDKVPWFNNINETLQRFSENLKLIVLPAIADSNIKIEHLEEIALAVYSADPAEIEAMNKKLETETSYTKAKPSPRKIEVLAGRFRESVYAFAFVLFIGCCIFYYTVVNYLEISKEYALTASVAIFIGLLTIYFRKQLR